MYIIIKLLSYYYYFIIIFFPHEPRGLHDPILVLINLISSSSYHHIGVYSKYVPIYLFKLLNLYNYNIVKITFHPYFIICKQ